MYSKIAFESSILVFHLLRLRSSICIEDQNDSILALSRPSRTLPNDGMSPAERITNQAEHMGSRHLGSTAPSVQLLLFHGEGASEAFKGHGVVAGQGELGAGESAFDRPASVLSREGDVGRAALGYFRPHLVGEVEGR